MIDELPPSGSNDDKSTLTLPNNSADAFEIIMNLAYPVEDVASENLMPGRVGELVYLCNMYDLRRFLRPHTMFWTKCLQRLQDPRTWALETGIAVSWCFGLEDEFKRAFVQAVMT